MSNGEWINPNADAEIEKMRREGFLRNHAGMRFENTRVRRDSPRRWEDADGQLAAPFPEDMPWPERQAADLARWGIDAPPAPLFPHLRK